MRNMIDSSSNRAAAMACASAVVTVLGAITGLTPIAAVVSVPLAVGAIIEIASVWPWVKAFSKDRDDEKDSRKKA